MANGTLKVSNIETSSGSGTITLGQSGETISIPSGATLDLSNATQTGVGGVMTPIFRATINGTQQVPNATHTKIEFDTEVFDPQSTFDTSNYRFTPAVAGYYFICAKIRSASDNDFGYFGCNIYKNGSEISSSNNAHFHFDSVSTSIIDLADDNDYYEVYTYHNEGGGMNYSNGTAAMQFFAHKLIT